MKNFALVQGEFLFCFGGSEAKEKAELQKELKNPNHGKNTPK